MNSKIYSIIQDSDHLIDKYLHYVARLAKDFDLSLELINPPLIKNNQKPKTIIGTGIPKIVSSEDSNRVNNDIIEKLSSKYETLKYAVSETFVENQIIENSLEDSILWTINQSSSNSKVGGINDTIETDLYEKLNIPSLTIPNNCDYKKPQKLLLMIRDITKINLKYFKQLVNKLNIEVVCAFEEEDSIYIKETIDTLHVELDYFKGKSIMISSQSKGQSFNKILEDERPEWIAFANYDLTFLERIYKSDPNQLKLTSNIPLLNF